MIFVLYIIVRVYDSHVILSCYYRTPVDRDYKKMTEQDCSRMVIHYGRNEFGNLSDIDVGPNGEVIVVDHKNNCVVVFDEKLDLFRVIGQGSDDSRLFGPDGVAVTDNVIAVSDWGRHQIKKYSLQGEFLAVIGSLGNKEGQFNCPRGLAFNNNKLLYVVDKGNFRVQVFQQDNKFASAFGNKGLGPGEFQSLIVIAIDFNNNVLVTDRVGHCIHLFDHHNQFIQKFACHNVYTIVTSPTGYLISGHKGDDNKIKIWSRGTDHEYNLIHQFGKKGFKQREFCGIMGMAMSPTGVIYVVEWENKRIQVIGNN